MKDLHSHILMGIDDGSKDINESIKILRQAQEKNITDIMLTPHYINNSIYNADNQKKKSLLLKLKEELKKEDININLYLGNEVYIDEDIVNLIKEKKISTLNDTRYVLIELPMREELKNDKEIIFNLITNNYIPVIAHPERYTYIQDDPNKIDKYIELGALFQGNYLSLYGNYGKSAQKTLKKLIKTNKITFLGSDIHKSSTDYKTEKLEKKLLKLTKNKEIVENLMNNNFEYLINNKEI